MNGLRIHAIAAALIICLAGSLPAEPPVRIGATGLKTVLPQVPPKMPRPSEGSGANETWRVGRAPGDDQPVASFVDSLAASDAAIQLIVGQGRILTTKSPIAKSDGAAVIAVGDPTIVPMPPMLAE